MNRSYAAKALDGFPSKRKEAVPEITDPQRVSWLRRRARLDAVGVKLWNELAALMSEMRVLTPADLLNLVVLADSYPTYISATETLQEEGMVIGPFY